MSDQTTPLALPPESLLQQLFVAVSAEQGLTQHSGNVPVLFADIVQYIKGNPGIDTARVEQSLKDNLQCRRWFNQLLVQQRRAFAPKEARADDSACIESRQSECFNLKFRVSKADSRQIYILLTVTAAATIADGDAVSLVIVNEEQVRVLRFGRLYDGQAQTMLLESDERLQLLRDAESELSLS